MRGVWRLGQQSGLCLAVICSSLAAHRGAAGEATQSGCCPSGADASLMYDAEAVPVRTPRLAPPLPDMPPPGTLGRTYVRRSWPVPAAKHPRVAMLDVRVPPGTTQVRVLTEFEYRDEDEIAGFQDPGDPCLWHFESKPLIPGVPHIYRVEAYGADSCDIRYVRLIRGRRVTLRF